MIQKDFRYSHSFSETVIDYLPIRYTNHYYASTRSFQQAKAPEPKAAPTFEDLAIDDQLTENQRVIKYVKSTIGLQRYGLTISIITNIGSLSSIIVPNVTEIVQQFSVSIIIFGLFYFLEA